MNEFTMEELIDLYVIVSLWYLKYPEDTSCKNLKDKILYLCDNYCEHDGEIGKDYPAEKCMKCNRMWE